MVILIDIDVLGLLLVYFLFWNFVRGRATDTACVVTT